MSENKELLEVKDLGITFFTDRGALPAVQEVSFNIKPGETLGVVEISFHFSLILSLS